MNIHVTEYDDVVFIEGFGWMHKDTVAKLKQLKREQGKL